MPTAQNTTAAQKTKQTPTISPMANAIRALAMDSVERANSGHPGMPMGMADVATVLFSKFLKFDPKAPNWPDRDRFVLSAGHGSMLLYALLYLTGYEDMSLDDLKNFRQLGAKTAGHPEYGHASGIETTTGPLGQGLANAVGMAMAEKLTAAQYGSDLVDHYTYAIAGDGCLMEGISHEAISLAGHLKLSKLIVLFDDNGISIDGPTSLSVSDDQAARFKASGWDVRSVDGHDAAAVEKAIRAAKRSNNPSLIACKTTIGYGAPKKAGTAGSHGAPLGKDEITGTRAALGWDHAPYDIPDDILKEWRKIGARGAKARKAWDATLGKTDAAKRKTFLRAMAGDLPDGWEVALTKYKKKLSEDAPKLATRASSQKALEVLTASIPEMVGGSADLTGSNNTKTADLGIFLPENRKGRYIHYGIREHGMAAAMNGMALHGGVRPYGGTFMCFTDYARPSMRLAALMKVPSVFVMTHDSIGLGEDGPTHQPVEHLAISRATPNTYVFRPCDTVETAEAWELALRSTSTPSVLSLTRQGVPTLRTEHKRRNMTALGAYVLAEAGATRKAILMATQEAQQWCEDMANKEELAQICAKRNWINAPFTDVVERMRGNFDYGNGKVVENSPFIMHYWAHHASYPFRSHDLWFLTEDIRWGYLPETTDTKALIDKVNREDLWRAAAAELGVTDIPPSTSRGPETFFDGKVFDPENPSAYLESLTIKRMA